MSAETRQVFPVPGCRAEPLVSYLKGLAVFRLLAEQADPSVRAWWSQGTLTLDTAMTEEDLVDFFLHRYEPSAILAPWNKDSKLLFSERPHVARADAAPRFHKLARVMDVIEASAPLAAFGLAMVGVEPDKLKKKKEKEKWAQTREKLSQEAWAWFSRAVRTQGESKAQSWLKFQALAHLRTMLDDEDLDWFDAVVLLTSQGDTIFPILLGSGGNDGRLEFSRNFVDRLGRPTGKRKSDHGPLFEWHSGKPNAQTEPALRASLFDEAIQGLEKVPIGRFHPGNAGGANVSAGPQGDGMSNPWDLIFVLEGALLFNASQVRRAETELVGGSLPFTVRMVGAGYPALAGADKGAREELWVPLWQRAASLEEIRFLFSEGRAMVGRRTASSALDFALAVGSLGVDRGIDSFVRYAFLERNGQATLGVPLGEWKVHREPQIDLLMEIETWLNRLEGHVRGKNTAASHVVAGQAVLDAVFSVARGGSPERWQHLLVAMADVDRIMATAIVHQQDSSKSGLRALFVPWLSTGWARAAWDDSVEFRLALSAASLWATRLDSAGKSWLPLLRGHLVDLPAAKPISWSYASEPSKQTCFRQGRPVASLADMAKLRLRLAREHGKESAPTSGTLAVLSSDMAAFLRGDIQWTRFEALLRGLSLLGPNLDWTALEDLWWDREPDALVDSQFALAKLALLPFRFPELLGSDKERIPMDPRIATFLSAGRSKQALELAARRLGQVGVTVFREALADLPGQQSRRLAAALLFPVSRRLAVDMAELVTRRGRRGEVRQRYRRLVERADERNQQEVEA